MDKLLYNEPDAREVLGGIGRSKLYALVADGKLTPTKIGRRTFFESAELERFVASLVSGRLSG